MAESSVGAAADASATAATRTVPVSRSAAPACPAPSTVTPSEKSESKSPVNDRVKVAMSVSEALRTTDDTVTVAPAGTPESLKFPAATPALKVDPVRSTVTVAPFRFPSPSVAGAVFVIDAASFMLTHFV